MSASPASKGDVIRWLARESVAAHAAAFLGVSLVAWFLIISPRIHAFGQKKAELASMKSILIGTQETLKRLKDLDALLAERRAELARLSRRTIKETDESSLIEAFTHSTEGLPASILNIRPEEENAGTGDPKDSVLPWVREGFRRKLLSVHLQCRYQTLGLLLERLAASPVGFGVKQIQIKKTDAMAPNLDITITLATYVEKGQA